MQDQECPLGCAFPRQRMVQTTQYPITYAPQWTCHFPDLPEGYAWVDDVPTRRSKKPAPEPKLNPDAMDWRNEIDSIDAIDDLPEPRKCDGCGVRLHEKIRKATCLGCIGSQRAGVPRTVGACIRCGGDCARDMPTCKGCYYGRANERGGFINRNRQTGGSHHDSVE